MSLSQSSVLKLYHNVIDDVIANVRESFLDDGVDEAVLQEMKQTWTNRLLASKAVEVNAEPQAPSQPSILTNNPKANGTKAKKTAAAAVSEQNKNTNISNVGSNMNGKQIHVPPLAPTQQKTTQLIAKQQQHQPANKSEAAQPTTSAQQPSQQQSNPPPLQATLDPNKMIPIQITLPKQHNETQDRVLTIKVPARAIQENLLREVITDEIVKSIMPLQPNVASTVLQQHVTSMLENMFSKNPIKLNRQVDGTAGDTSDEDGSDISDDNFDVDDDELKDDDEEDGGAEEEPLNSEDDVTDEDDAADLFETENVVVCQYDKINRSRNKWKFYLKDGIMNLGGKDYVFQKSNGDAEW